MKLDHLGVPYTRINSKWFKILNVRLETIKILEESIGSQISDISHRNIFFLIYLLWQRKKNKQWDYIKLKSFCPTKETINKMKRQPTEWENLFTNNTSDKGLISKMYKTLTPKNKQSN